jgi:hypothetical protein
MSQGLAAARKRRAPASLQPPNPPPTPSPSLQQQPNPSMGLTLPQVIALVDQRLVIVETFMKNMQSSETPGFLPQSNDVSIPNNATNPILEEINSRYDLLAEEVINLKNIVLSLQSYTMEVNKTLMEERIRILSDVMEPIENSSVGDGNLVVENINN